MKTLILHLFCFVLSISVYGDEFGHTIKGTEYNSKAVTAYSESNHGPDGSLFLDPYFKKDIENIKNKKILDAGCGAAPWAIYAAKQGGVVYAIDIQHSMIQKAKNAIELANLDDKIFLTEGDVASLPYNENFFDKEISICVGCNLPPESFEKHLIECYRTLKKNGIIVVGAPTSLDVVFTDGTKTESEAFLHIADILAQLPDNPSYDIISEKLTELTEVLSATFYIKNSRLVLLANEKELKDGENIWRKLPKLVVPNRFYSKEYYISMFNKCNLEVAKIDLPHFNNEEERTNYNLKSSPNHWLGQAYVAHAPFVIFHLKKHEVKNTNRNFFGTIVGKTLTSMFSNS